MKRDLKPREVVAFIVIMVTFVAIASYGTVSESTHKDLLIAEQTQTIKNLQGLEESDKELKKAADELEENDKKLKEQNYEFANSINQYSEEELSLYEENQRLTQQLQHLRADCGSSHESQ